MLIHFFYALNLILLLAGLLVFRLDSSERQFSLALVQVLMGLPLLAGEYAFLAYHMEPQVVMVVLFSESVFAVIWFSMTHRLRRATVSTAPDSGMNLFFELVVWIAVVIAAGYCLDRRPTIEISYEILMFNFGSPQYFYSFFLLMPMLYSAWRLEQFWRFLEPARRWEYKFLVVGSYLVCGTLVWASSYRLTYLNLIHDHFLLLATLLLLAWSLMLYAVARHRLLNRRIFVSRKIVYSFVAPCIFAIYLCGLGIVSLVIRYFGLSLPFVLRWLFLAVGLVGLGLFACSGKLRRRVHFFISTHFYINKYEYRDEWLILSRELQGATTEADVVKALYKVLAESLYATDIRIWLGDIRNGYIYVPRHGNHEGTADGDFIVLVDPLIRFLNEHPFFYLKEREPDKAWKELVKDKGDFLGNLSLELFVPLSIGNQIVGLIGVGPEFTGGRYGLDDFDLLIALAGQAASALLAVRMAEELARAREQQALDKLSAFVLHDVKNAASMLSLVRENAPNHIQDPEFQQDMLEVLDDTLGRMAKVEARLKSLKGEITPVRQELELCGFLEDCIRRIRKNLRAMKLDLDCHGKIHINIDPGLFSRVLENLMLNALEAGGSDAVVRITAGRDEERSQVVIEITDNGPGIPEELLPVALFGPFRTTKPGGSGIGLWQVRRLVTSLNGTVSAENVTGGGARFVVRFPLQRHESGP